MDLVPLALDKDVRAALCDWLDVDADPGVRWRPDVWRKWVPLDGLPSDCITDGRIFRSDLRALANDATSSDEQALAFAVGVFAWGSGMGTKGEGDPRGPWRAATAMRRSTSPHSVGHPQESIEAVQEAVRRTRGNPADGWSWMITGRGHLPMVGPAFFTKFLYAAGYGVGAEPWPLVYDSRVRAALGKFGRPNRERRVPYIKYLNSASQWAQAFDVEPQQIEYALFKHS